MAGPVYGGCVSGKTHPDFHPTWCSAQALGTALHRCTVTVTSPLTPTGPTEALGTPEVAEWAGFGALLFLPELLLYLAFGDRSLGPPDRPYPC